MLSLNLISEELKEKKNLKRTYELINKASIIFVFVTIFFGLIFLGAKIIMESNFKELNNQANLTPLDGENYNLKAKEINEKISNTNNIQNEFIFYSDLIKNITEKIPENVALEYLKIDKEKKTIKIKGNAQKRNDLLELKEKLTELDLIDDINLPLQNILEKENINFEINAKINLN